jgi:hypothetical protein
MNMLLQSPSMFHLRFHGLLALRIQDLGHAASSLRELRTLAADKIPWEVEHLVHGFETLARGFGQKEPHPCETHDRDAAEEHHGSASRHADEHERYRL